MAEGCNGSLPFWYSYKLRTEMKKSIKVAMMMAAAMMATASDPIDTRLYREHRNPYEGETDEERRKRLHKMYGESQQEHEFVIKGEHIMARNKKTALKIYTNRHPQSKKRKK